jgi:hypothetical protein
LTKSSTSSGLGSRGSGSRVGRSVLRVAIAYLPVGTDE